MLSDNSFADRLAVLKDFYEAGDHVQALHYSHVLKQDILRDGPIEAAQLGWVRFYAFRALFCLSKYDEAWNYLETKENHIFILGVNEGALLYNNAMEIAVRLSKPVKDLITWGQKALDLRLASNDLPGAVDTINTLCTFLGVMNQDQYNAKYAEQLIDMGMEYSADRLIIGGVAHLMRNPKVAQDSDLKKRVRERHAVFANAFNGPFKDEARAIYIDYLHFCNSLT